MFGSKWADGPDVSKLAVIPGFRSVGPKPNPRGNHKKQGRGSGHRPPKPSKDLFHPTAEPNRDGRLVPDSNESPDLRLECARQGHFHFSGAQDVVERRIVSFLGTVGLFLIHFFRIFYELFQNKGRFSRSTFMGLTWSPVSQTPRSPQTLAFYSKSRTSLEASRSRNVATPVELVVVLLFFISRSD